MSIPESYRNRPLPLTPPAAQRQAVEDLKGCRAKIHDVAREMFKLGEQDPKPHHVQAALAQLRRVKAGDIRNQNAVFVEAKQALEEVRGKIPLVKKALSKGDSSVLEALDFLRVGSRTAKGLGTEFVLLNTAIELNTKTGELLYPGTSHFIQGIEGIQTGSLETGQVSVSKEGVEHSGAFEVAHAFRTGCAQVGAVQASVDHVTLASIAVRISLAKRDLRNAKAKLETIDLALNTRSPEMQAEQAELKNEITRLSAKIELLRGQRKQLIESTAVLDSARWALYAGSIPPLVSSTAAAAIASAAIGHVAFGALLTVHAAQKFHEVREQQTTQVDEQRFLSSETTNEWVNKGSEGAQEIKRAMVEGKLDQLQNIRKKQLKADVFRAALHTLTGLVSIGSGALTVALVAGAAVSAAAIAATGIGLVVLAAATLLIGAATFVYRRRKSIMAAISLKTTLTVQERKLQNKIKEGGPGAKAAKTELAELQSKIADTERIAKSGWNLLKARFGRWRARREYNDVAKKISDELWVEDLDEQFEAALKKVDAAETRFAQCKAVAAEVAVYDRVSKKATADAVETALAGVEDPEALLLELATVTAGFEDIANKAQSMLTRPGDLGADLRRLVYGWIDAPSKIRHS